MGVLGLVIMMIPGVLGRRGYLGTGEEAHGVGSEGISQGCRCSRVSIQEDVTYSVANGKEIERVGL